MEHELQAAVSQNLRRNEHESDEHTVVGDVKNYKVCLWCPSACMLLIFAWRG